jgi:hypothetical protein
MKKVSLDINQLIPSQDYLKEDTVKYILECYERNDMLQLPPPPLVRLHPGDIDKYIAID